jgi:release factor glutamine methyltransferase
METNPEDDYARGWVPFLDCKIFLDSHPLIPRLETEYWVEKAIERINKEAAGGFLILDLFAGSGAIGIALLKHLENARVDFGEIDASHFPTIKKSLKENGIGEQRAHMIETDVWSSVSGRYDAVFANPPYISAKDITRVQSTVIALEPHRALFAEEDGMEYIRRTIEGAADHVKPGGMLFLEHDPEQSPAISALGETHGFSTSQETDQFGLKRWTVLTVA